MCSIAEEFANGSHEQDVKEAARCFNTPESQEVLAHATGGRHGALKRNNPTVKFPLKIANILRAHYNKQHPHCSPEEAASRVRLLSQYSKSLYVRYVMEAIKIKAFFSTLKAKEVNGVVPELGEVQEASDGYKQWTTVDEMRGEHRRRMESGTMKKLLRQPKDKHGWAMALELNDLQAASVITNNMEEAAHAERAAETMAEDGDQSGVDFEDDGGESDEEDGNAAPGDAHLQCDLLGDDGATPE